MPEQNNNSNRDYWLEATQVAIERGFSCVDTAVIAAIEDSLKLKNENLRRESLREEIGPRGIRALLASWLKGY